MWIEHTYYCGYFQYSFPIVIFWDLWKTDVEHQRNMVSKFPLTIGGGHWEERVPVLSCPDSVRRYYTSKRSNVTFISLYFLVFLHGSPMIPILVFRSHREQLKKLKNVRDQWLPELLNTVYEGSISWLMWNGACLFQPPLRQPKDVCLC